MNTPTPVIDLAHANADLFAALAAAQQEAQTVGKDAQNTQRGYKYASAESMVRAARAAMAGTGLAIISTWTSEPAEIPDGGDIGNQFACATVIESFVVTHSSGGYITGRAELDAIASRARPYDKAVAAAATYMHGFVLRHVLNLDRAEDGELAVDQRGDEGFTPTRTRPASKNATALSPEAQARYNEFRHLCKERGDLQRTTGATGETVLPIRDRLAAIIGVRDSDHRRWTTEQWETVNKGLADDIADMRATQLANELEGDNDNEHAAE